MSVRKKFSGIALIILSGVISLGNYKAIAAGDVKLYTPFTKITVPPGEPIDYTIDVINKGTEIRDIDISLTGMPGGWTYDLKSGAYNIRQISVMPGEKGRLSLKVFVPFKVNKGSYHFQINAGEFDVLPLTVTVSEQGTFKTEFNTKQPNMEGNASMQFSFQATLQNRTADKQLYALMADAPRGWNVIFRANYKQSTSVELEANSSADVSIDITPSSVVQAGTYKIPVIATTAETSAQIDLEVVITGTYNMVLTTPTGLLSTSVTAGDTKKVELVVNNTGSSKLTGIKFDSSTPINWDVTFDPKGFDFLEPGKSAHAFAVIKVDKRAIAGDYVTTLEAKTIETSSKAAFRVSVKTPMLYGWIGVFIIVFALGCVYYLFRKYGRR